MTSDRPYRKALSTDYAREELSRFSGVLYDPEIVEAFLDIHQSELDEISRCCAELIDPA